ncbi:HEPN domain protein [Peptococcaceae bacterium CEB3]|nr:HEPN domain protein [Peptococcaceae bacterium CEB3]
MNNLSCAQEWRSFAEMDLSSAEYLLGMRPMSIEIICYHCQQAAEKILKGYLALKGEKIPKIHDLDDLRMSCLKYSESFEAIADPCTNLTAYGVQARYPFNSSLDEQDMHWALKDAKDIQNTVLTMVPEMKSSEAQDTQTKNGPTL